MSNTLSALLEETELLEKQLDSLEAGITSMEKMSMQNSLESLSEKLNMVNRSSVSESTLSASASRSDNTSGNMNKMLREMLTEHRKIASAVSDLKEDFTAFRDAGKSSSEAVTI